MKILIPILTIFALLTQPDGWPIRVAKAQIAAIFRNTGECAGYGPRNDKETHAVIMLTNGARLCVAEHPDTAATAVESP